MPRLAELQKQIKRLTRPLARAEAEEVLIADLRGQRRPGDFIEQKLQVALRKGVVTQAARTCSARGVATSRNRS
jgi:hypothetical protein